MAENTRVIREQKWLETNMNVPLVDYNLHVCALRGRNIPYDIWLGQLIRQSNMGKQKSGIPHRQNSLQTNLKVNTSNIQTKLQVSREMSMYTSPRPVLPPALIRRSDRVNLSPFYIRQKQTSDILIYTPQVE